MIYIFAPRGYGPRYVHFRMFDLSGIRRSEIWEFLRTETEEMIINNDDDDD